MISFESKTIIGDREAFAELHPKTALGAVDLWHVLAQQRCARADGEHDRKTQMHMVIVAAT
jgi:hypothetical protein